MTEKRFTYERCDGFEDNGVYITPYDVVELLNKQDNLINTYNEGAKTLKATIDQLTEDNTKLKTQLNKCKKDNQHLIFERQKL